MGGEATHLYRLCRSVCCGWRIKPLELAMKVIAKVGLAALLALSSATPVFADNISVGNKSKPFTTKTLFDQIYREIR
jgi:hypothetical protein